MSRLVARLQTKYLPGAGGRPQTSHWFAGVELGKNWTLVQRPGSRSTENGDGILDQTSSVLKFNSSHAVLRHIFQGRSLSETAILHSGLPFSVLSQPYIATVTSSFRRTESAPSSSMRRPTRTGFPACPCIEETLSPGRPLSQALDHGSTLRRSSPPSIRR